MLQNTDQRGNKDYLTQHAVEDLSQAVLAHAAKHKVGTLCGVG